MSESKENLAYLAASLCYCYGAVPKRVSEHMTVKSFSNYTRKMFVDTMKIGMEMHGYGAKIEEFDEKIGDPKFDCLFKPDEPDEVVMDPKDIPEDVVISKEDDIDEGLVDSNS